MRCLIPILCLILFAPLGLSGQNLLPPIYNYRVFEYNAAGQNWGLSVNDQGELFGANDKGLLHFNGEEWVLNKLPNATIIRSVACVDDKIYTGSYEEFGYWKKNRIGEFEYTSLTQLITDHTFTNEEFWQIIPYGDKIAFRSFSTLYLYEEDSINIINPEFVVTNIAAVDNKILVASKSDGLYELVENKLQPINTGSALENFTIISMAAFQDGFMIGTQLNGSFLYRNGALEPFDEEINQLLKQHQLNKILTISSDEIAFGTIKNGIYLYNTKEKSIKNLNRATGLQNNTVLSMAKFDNQIWAGLENGLDRIDIESPISYFTDYSGSLGTTHDLVHTDSITYLGSNTGIYYLNNDFLNFINGSQGHVWDLEIIDDDIMAGHNTATFSLDESRLKKISQIAGGYQFVRVPESSATFLQGTYTGVAKYKRDNDNNWSISEINGIDFPVKQLCFEDARTLWAAHPYKGLFRFKLDENLTSVVEKKEFGSEVIPNIYQVKLYEIKNQIIIQSNGIWYKYDPIIAELSTFDEFKPYNQKSIMYADGEHFWFIDHGPSKEITYTDLQGQTISINEGQLGERLVPDMERIIRKNDSIYLLTLSDGFAQINLAKLQRKLANTQIPSPKLSFFKDVKQAHTVRDSAFEISYPNSSVIDMQFSVPSLIKPRYYYILAGPMNKESYSDHGTLSFQNLAHGEYTLSVSSVSMDNKKSPPTKLVFEIAPPWYLSTLSLVAYLLALVGIIFLVRMYNKQKLKKKHETLKIKLEREQDERMAKLEKEKLEKEIRGKQNELARTTMSVAKKNELILELKDLMLVNKDAFPNKRRYRSLTKKLDSSINEDEDWKQFEMNFKELHNDYFENLLKQYPKLTPKDLKLCAYLKMNLSTKEIAPLMAITVRGVEIHRYRLRKKLEIDSSQNLSSFLIKFK